MKMKVKDLAAELAGGPSDSAEYDLKFFNKSTHKDAEIEELRWDDEKKVLRIEVR